MTLRRLRVLVLGLPAGSSLWQSLQAAEDAAAEATPDRLRERQAKYEGG